MASGDASRIERLGAFVTPRAGPTDLGRRGGSVKPMTRFLGAAKPACAVAVWVTLLGFPAGPALDPGPAASGTVLAAASAAGAEPVQIRRRQRLPALSPDEGQENSGKHQRDLLKFKFEKMKEDADELAELAKSLQEDLDESNENVLSVEVVKKAEKIEKLAKKIRSAARGF